MGFPAARSNKDYLPVTAFQSLVGVYGFSRLFGRVLPLFLAVSIPSRGLWVFPRYIYLQYYGRVV